MMNETKKTTKKRSYGSPAQWLGLSLAAFVGLSACAGSAEDSPKDEIAQVGDEIRDVADATSDAVESTAEEYRDAIAAKLDEIDKNLEEMKSALERQGDAVTSETKESLARLEETREAFEEQLKALDSTSGDAWKSLRSGVDEAMNELQDAFEDVKREVETS